VSVDAPVINPTTGVAFASVHQADRDEVDQAIERAGRAQPRWSATAPSDRARLLRRFAHEVDQAIEELAQL
jgi:acyl-CoA reductase-like NAD-dependent aldehyde dehydrogenase